MLADAEGTPSWGRTDAVALVALTFLAKRRTYRVANILERADYADRVVLSRDELIDGVNKLVAVGLVTVDAHVPRLDPTGIALMRPLRKADLGHVVTETLGLLSSVRLPTEVTEVWSLTAAAYDAAVDQYGESMRKWWRRS
jgi:urease gamma subunit